jgi:diguanylate cyclase (GGDEF)-like protein
MAAAMAAVLVIGVLDYLTGTEASIAPLYLVPIAFATWAASPRVGILIAILSAVVRLQDLWMLPRHHAHALMPYWNGVVELGFFVVVATLLTKLRNTTEHWATLARTDPLTGVLNRRAFIETATLELARAERYRHPLTLAYVDIDDFKRVNDQGGHTYGDQVLVEVAKNLRRNLRAFDVVARYGGDEFVLLLPEADDRAAGLVLERAMAALHGAMPGRSAVSLSIGAVTVAGPGIPLERLLEQADQLVYAAKQDGKDCVRHRHLDGNGATGRTNTPTPDVTVLFPRFATPSIALQSKGR